MDQLEILNLQLKKLIKAMEGYNSFWRSFGRGIFFGVGSAIGASIVAAIVIGILTRIKDSLSLSNIFR